MNTRTMLSAELVGFKRSTKTGIQLKAGDHLREDLDLGRNNWSTT